VTLLTFSRKRTRVPRLRASKALVNLIDIGRVENHQALAHLRKTGAAPVLSAFAAAKQLIRQGDVLPCATPAVTMIGRSSQSEN